MAEKEQNPLSTPLVIIAILCFIIGLSPESKGYTDPETNERITEWRLGLSSSPLWEYQNRESPGNSFRFESRFNIFSWSSLLLVIGTIALKMRSWRRRERKKG